MEEDRRRWVVLSSRGRVAIYDETFKEIHHTFTLLLPSASSSSNELVPVAKVRLFSSLGPFCWDSFGIPSGSFESLL